MKRLVFITPHNIITTSHGGDPNYATYSVFIDVNGNILEVKILINVMNRTCECEWSFRKFDDFKFQPFIKNNKSYITEYIGKIYDSQYCVPLIKKDGTVVKRKH